MTPYRTIFAGTPEFAVPSLAALLARPEFEVVAVYTQPDRPAGRGRNVKPGPIKVRATAADITVRQPLNFREAGVLDAFDALKPDLFVVAAYGLILPIAVLEIPRHTINVHASLLPRWRGAAPIQRALMAGDKTTGISIMRVVERLDAGPVWLRRECAIASDETSASLHDKLANLGGAALDAALDLIVGDCIEETEQDESARTYADKITAADRKVDWTRDSLAIERQVRALAPRPGCLSSFGGIDVQILKATIGSAESSALAGTITGYDEAGICVATGSGVLCVTELRPAGKQTMSAAAFVNGYGKLL